jgi:repressor LexA
VKGSTKVRDQSDHVVTDPGRGVYAGIRDFLQGHNSPATVNEVCGAIGMNVSCWLDVLPRKGYLPGGAVHSSTAQEQRPWRPALHVELDALPREVSLPSPVGATVLVPVYGRIPAGPLNLAHQAVANQGVESAFLLDRQPVGEGTLFMLKVAGDSMINAGIADGNWVVVRQQEDAQNGEIVAAMIGGEVTVKTLHLEEPEDRKQPRLLELVPQNPDYQPIPGGDVTILGKVVGVVCQA